MNHAILYNMKYYFIYFGWKPLHLYKANLFCFKFHCNLCLLLFFSPHFDDEERLRVLVNMSAQELSNGVSYMGHNYAMTRAARSLTPTADLSETFNGMDQVSGNISSAIIH